MFETLWFKAILAYLHYASFIGVFITLALELVLFKPKITTQTAKLLQKADGLYGLFAILVVTTGLIRVFYLEKGSDYYFSNYIFLVKFGLFIVIGILSIWPTVYFMKWRKLLNSGAQEIETEHSKYKFIRRFIHIELSFLALLPLLAALMARGYGF